MSEPFQIDILRRKIIPNPQHGVLINIHKETIEEVTSTEEVDAVESKKEGEPKKQKTIIKDRRKYSTIERSLILDKLKKQKIFKVNIEKVTDKPKPTETERIIVPVGEPIGIFTKVDKVVLKKKVEKEAKRTFEEMFLGIRIVREKKK